MGPHARFVFLNANFMLSLVRVFLLSGKSPFGSSFAGCFLLFQQFSRGKILAFMTEHDFRGFTEHSLQRGFRNFNSCWQTCAGINVMPKGRGGRGGRGVRDE